MRTAFRIEHRLGVPAPASVVWGLISDLERWPAWNPLAEEVQGALRIGERLVVRETIPGEGAAVIRPMIVDWEPSTQILWRFTEKAGLVGRLRYLEIEKLTDDACIFSIGEDWSGPLARLTPRTRRRTIREAFKTLADALRSHAMAAVGAGDGAPSPSAA